MPFEEEKHLSGRPTYKTHPQNIYNPPGHHIYPTTTLYNPPGYPCIHVDIPHYLTFVITMTMMMMAMAMMMMMMSMRISAAAAGWFCQEGGW